MEELVAEYLQLAGYFVVTNHPVPTKKRGGRSDMDVLGLKIVGNKVHALHIEIGRARDRKALEKKIKQQLLSQKVGKELDKILKTFADKRERWFISETRKRESGIWQDLREKYKKDVRLMTFPELMKEIRKTMKEWKEKESTSKGRDRMLPKSLWLLKMLERMSELNMWVSWDTYRRLLAVRGELRRRDGKIRNIDETIAKLIDFWKKHPKG